MADLSAATEEDVKSFFRLYYAPNNAILWRLSATSIRSRRRRGSTKYFGGIPRGKRDHPAGGGAGHARRRAAAGLRGPRAVAAALHPVADRRREARRPFRARRARRSILSGPRTARLTKALVYDKQTAASVSAGQSTNEDVGDFIMIITPRPGTSLTDLEQAADAIIERIKAEGPTAEEIQKATAGEELGSCAGWNRISARRCGLSDGAGFHGDPGYFRTEYSKGQSVTAADVKRVANKYLTEGPRGPQRRADGQSSIRRPSRARARRSGRRRGGAGEEARR